MCISACRPLAVWWIATSFLLIIFAGLCVYGEINFCCRRRMNFECGRRLGWKLVESCWMDYCGWAMILFGFAVFLNFGFVWLYLIVYLVCSVLLFFVKKRFYFIANPRISDTYVSLFSSYQKLEWFFFVNKTIYY